MQWTTILDRQNENFPCVCECAFFNTFSNSFFFHCVLFRTNFFHLSFSYPHRCCFTLRQIHQRYKSCANELLKSWKQYKWSPPLCATRPSSHSFCIRYVLCTQCLCYTDAYAGPKYKTNYASTVLLDKSALNLLSMSWKCTHCSYTALFFPLPRYCGRVSDCLALFLLSLFLNGLVVSVWRHS